MATEHLEEALASACTEIQKFLDDNAVEIDKLTAHREQLITRREEAQRDLSRATRALAALRGDDEQPTVGGGGSAAKLDNRYAGRVVL